MRGVFACMLSIVALQTRVWAGATAPPLTETRTTYYVTDAVGSVRGEVSEEGALTTTHRYTPFGLAPAEPPPAQETPQFGSQLRLPATGTDDFHARHYQPDAGRFVSVDPRRGVLSDPQTFNRYSYALNNPLKYGDPDGRTPRRLTMTDDNPGTQVLLTIGQVTIYDTSGGFLHVRPVEENIKSIIALVPDLKYYLEKVGHDYYYRDPGPDRDKLEFYPTPLSLAGRAELAAAQERMQRLAVAHPLAAAMFNEPLAIVVLGADSFGSLIPEEMAWHGPKGYKAPKCQPFCHGVVVAEMDDAQGPYLQYRIRRRLELGYEERSYGLWRDILYVVAFNYLSSKKGCAGDYTTRPAFADEIASLIETGCSLYPVDTTTAGMHSTWSGWNLLHNNLLLDRIGMTTEELTALGPW